MLSSNMPCLLKICIDRKISIPAAFKIWKFVPSIRLRHPGDLQGLDWQGNLNFLPSSNLRVWCRKINYVCRMLGLWGLGRGTMGTYRGCIWIIEGKPHRNLAPIPNVCQNYPLPTFFTGININHFLGTCWVLFQIYILVPSKWWLKLFQRNKCWQSPQSTGKILLYFLFVSFCASFWKHFW